jgi:AcrR family transcriptional regulator
MDEIATDANVAKTTIYRRWKSKEALVTRCLQVYAMQISPPPTGDWRTDVVQALKSMILVSSTPQGRAFMSVLAARFNNPDLEISFGRDYEEGSSPAVMRNALTEGVRVGELRRDLDVDLTIELLLSVVFMRVVALREPVEPASAESIVDAVLRGALQPR